MDLSSYLLFHWEPITGLFVGAFLFGIAGYLNWYWPAKTAAIRWTATHIFGDEASAEASASGMFSVATGFLVVIGWIWAGLAVMYLWNG
jgi:hypothetical protein